ncbi:uncharacterized protein LOC134823085 [Bolinopsis microptera]|uniref:uncharacterized protein LOC134823085 n=1 Tax=Bolinopsis microptera TaxID=2820187 RepID=UPI003078B73A
MVEGGKAELDIMVEGGKAELDIMRMACEWEEYESRLNQLGYAEYDNETLISARVHNFAELKTLNTVVALVEIGMGISCVICNILVLQHYVQRLKELTPLLYSAVLIVDLIAGIGSLLQGLTLLLLSYTSYTSSYFWYLAPITYTLNSLASHTSVFYSTVLVTARTIMITRPRTARQVSPVLVALLVGYPALWLGVILWEVWIECVYWEENTLEMIIDLFVIIPTTLGSLDYYLGYIWTCEPITPATSSILSHVIPFGVPSLVSGSGNSSSGPDPDTCKQVQC